MEIKAMIKNDCTFCFKALELQRALDLGLIAERNRCNEKIKAIEYEKQVEKDRMQHFELVWDKLFNFITEYYEATDEEEEMFLKKFEYFSKKAIKEALEIDKPIDRS